MKTNLILTYILTFFAFAAVAQGVENDDMYFTAEDRVKLREQKAVDEAAYASVKKNKKKEVAAEEESFNPTDSYSARNINPEYAARENAESAQSDNQDYFVQDYRYATASNFNNWNNNFNNWYGNSWYTPSWFGPSINSWNSRYYGFHDPYYSPWYDPYWNYNGWSASFSYHWGNSWNYGWGGSYNYWNRPYLGWASAWGPGFGYGYGSGFGRGWYGYPGSVIVVNNNYGEAGGRKVTYGKRPSRSTVMETPQNTSSRVRSSSITPNRDNSSNSGGRVSSNSNRRQEDYYNRSWRYTAPAQNGSDNNNSNSSWVTITQGATITGIANVAIPIGIIIVILLSIPVAAAPPIVE